MGAVVLFLTGCIEKGDKILIVKLSNDKDELSEQAVIKESLEKGGLITINVELARKIDKHFDQRFAISDTDGNFLTKSALLNFIGFNGWKYNSGNSIGGYYFTQPRAWLSDL